MTKPVFVAPRLSSAQAFRLDPAQAPRTTFFKPSSTPPIVYRTPAPAFRPPIQAPKRFPPKVETIASRSNPAQPLSPPKTEQKMSLSDLAKVSSADTPKRGPVERDMNDLRSAILAAVKSNAQTEARKEEIKPLDKIRAKEVPEPVLRQILNTETKDEDKKL